MSGVPSLTFKLIPAACIHLRLIGTATGFQVVPQYDRSLLALLRTPRDWNYKTLASKLVSEYYRNRTWWDQSNQRVGGASNLGTPDGKVHESSPTA